MYAALDAGERDLVTPLLLLLFAGIVDFGFMFQRYLVLTNAAREGARIAVLPGYGTGDVQARVADYYRAGTTPTAPAATAAVSRTTITPGGGAPFAAARVAVTTTYTPLLLGRILQFFGRSFAAVTLTATAEMRVESGM